MVTAKFFEHIKKQFDSKGAFEARVTRLGYSTEAFYRMVASSFDTYKFSFTEDLNPRWIVIHSRREGNHDDEPFTIVITK